VAALLPTMLSLAVFHGWQKSLIIAGAFIGLEIITGNYLEPRIYGKHTGLSSLAVLVAAAFWTLIWGLVGLVLSVPLTVCLVVIGRHVPSLEFLTVMLGDKPAMPAWMCFYQRLLVHDQHEAAEILESSLKQKPLEEVYDSVLIPALVPAEDERQHSDLEDSTVRFIRHTAREFVEELGFSQNRGAEIEQFESLTPALPGNGHSMNVICVPVRDENDELAALMAAQVLDGGSIRALPMAAAGVDELARSAAAEKPDLAFLCALPPVGLVRCHRVYRSLRARNPRLRIMIGIWNYPENADDAARKISGGEETRMWTHLSDALPEVRALAEGNAGAAAGLANAADQSAA
jgi:hypothetical protein